MSATGFIDVVSVIAFGSALLFVVLTPVDTAHTYLRPAKVLAAAAMALFTFVGLANYLGDVGMPGAFGGYPFYAQLLFLPLVTYLVYSLSVAQRLEDSQRSESAVTRDHQMLTDIIDTSATGIVVVGHDGKITFANRVAQEQLGLRAVDGGAVYEPARDLRMGPETGSVTDVARGLEEIVSHGTTQGAVRYIEHPDGHLVGIEMGARPLELHGTVVGTAVSFADVTERLRYRHELELFVNSRTRELMEVNRQLAEANDAKRQFLTRMSHELRTPLNAIIGFTGTLLHGMTGDLDSEQRRQLEIVRDSGQHLLRLVNDVLDISLIESGRTVVNLASVGVCEISRGVLAVMAPVAAETEIDLELDCPDEIGEVVTDADKLSQVLRNLVVNAIKFTEPGGWIRVFVRGDERNVRISVGDSGVGIPEEDLPRVFEAFERTGDGRLAGTGLGLAICRDVARALGGDVSAVSEIGRGSTFTVTIPREPTPKPVEPPSTPAKALG